MGQQQVGRATANLLTIRGSQQQQQIQQQLHQQLHRKPAPPLQETEPHTPHQENRTQIQEHPMPIQEPRTCTPHQQQASSSGFIAMDVNESTKQVRATEDAILQGKFNYCVILFYLSYLLIVSLLLFFDWSSLLFCSQVQNRKKGFQNFCFQ